jgi:hypothetical protein
LVDQFLLLLLQLLFLPLFAVFRCFGFFFSFGFLSPLLKVRLDLLLLIII